MASLWTSAISSAWSVASDVMGMLLPVLGVGVGLAITAGVVGIFLGRNGG